MGCLLKIRKIHFTQCSLHTENCTENRVGIFTKWKSQNNHWLRTEFGIEVFGIEKSVHRTWCKRWSFCN